ncbi:hypothetical protein FRP1_07675 [Pseudonocardia sp. EC080625-04]|nr:hypothetical protein FRP1_07675 [Pseudonocardia sp. EC080625-04]
MLAKQLGALSIQLGQTLPQFSLDRLRVSEYVGFLTEQNKLVCNRCAAPLDLRQLAKLLLVRRGPVLHILVIRVELTDDGFGTVKRFPHIATIGDRCSDGGLSRTQCTSDHVSRVDNTFPCFCHRIQ